MPRKYLILTLLLALIGVAISAGIMPVGARPDAQAKNCPGVPASRLIVGGSGRVTITEEGQTPIPVRVRETAGRSGKIVGQLIDGTPFQVEEGPTCKDNFAWWRIKTASLEGWVAEGDSTDYYVEPVGNTNTANGDGGGEISRDGGAATAQPAQPTPGNPTATPIPANGGTITAERKDRFALFKVGDVDTAGKLQPYVIAPDFNNLVAAAPLTAEQMNFVQRNGFVVSPGNELEFYTVYEKARYDYQPLFITSDSLLHSFHLVFDKVLRTAEAKYFIPLLLDMNSATLVEADKLYQALKGTDWEDAAKRTVAYLSVPTRLLDLQAKIPSYVNDIVAQEVSNVNNAAGIAASAIFPELSEGEDFTQYIPRGHYAKSDALKAYFRAMMYYGRMTFRLSKPEETKSALLLVLALRDANVNGRRGLDTWADLYDPTVFFVGKADDLTIPQYLQVVNQVYGEGAKADAIKGKGIEPFVAAAQVLPAPKVLNAVIQDTDDVNKETKGLRFMGQRFVWDAYVFRELVYRNVGTRDKPRGLPMALDVFAALGSDRALKILEKEGVPTFENYLKQMEKVRGEVGALVEPDWTETLYGSWLYALDGLAKPIPNGYPTFMTNEAYMDRLLYAALASFTELKHDTILYAEQSYAEMGGGGGKSPPPEPATPPNYVEPVPLFWARLGALAEMTLDGLGSRKLLDENDSNTLKLIAELARKFQAYSIKELNNQPLSAQEQDGLRFYGGDLEKILSLTSDTVDPNAPPGGAFMSENKPQAAIVTDVATDPQGQQVLQLGTGRVFDIFAAVPINGKLWLAHGAVFSYYEFSQPLNKRLTDEAWQKMIDEAKAPSVPDWTFSFMSKATVDAELITGVRNFQNYLIYSLWSNPVASYKQFQTNSAKDKISKFLAGQLEALAKARQYEGRKILETSFRSFDMQGADTAVVTTRETWLGELHNYGATEDEDGPKIAERGPYTVDVTYTLTKSKEGQWGVTNVVVNGTLPPWKTAS